MLPINTPIKMPAGFRALILVRPLALLILPGIFFLILGLNPNALAFFLGLIAVFCVFWYIFSYLDFINFNVVIGEHNLTVNSGIIVKQSKTLNFSSVQTVDIVNNPWLAMFGLNLIRIWSSSPQQLNIQGGTTANAPEAIFYLTRADAQEFKQLLTANK
jgi:uncharacterized membrane protein YdbT with pleckstrin-like domain